MMRLGLNKSYLDFLFNADFDERNHNFSIFDKIENKVRPMQYFCNYLIIFA